VNDAAIRLASRLGAAPYPARLGFRPGDVMTDVATASVAWLPVLANAQGFVHGGVAASLSVWASMIVAVASARDEAASARPISVHVEYLAAAREEAVHATARVLSRGRDLVHVGVELESESGRSVASALAVLRTGPAPARAMPAASPALLAKGVISPFSQAMGIELRRHDAASVEMAMRLAGNEGDGGSVDPGALLSLADTCAALACLPSLDERPAGSATLSLSAVFGDLPSSPLVAEGRQVAEDGGVRSAAIEIRADGPSRSRLPALSACVAYRFVAAERE
jgi:uncharacterized protein (TIGR00369 family)